MKGNKIPTLKCLRCGHSWMPRKATPLPKYCPKCISPYWNKAKTKEVSKLVQKADLEKITKEFMEAHEKINSIPDQPLTVELASKANELFARERDLHTKHIKMYRTYVEQRKIRE